MARRQSQMFRPRRRRATRSSGGGGGLFVLLAILVAFVLLGSLVQFLQTPAGIVSLFIVGLIVVFFIWKKRKKDQQRLALLIQQQQAAWAQQQQQQEAAQQAAWQRQQMFAQMQWEQMERERQEQERREKERIAQMHSLGDILALKPKEFEMLTGKILEESGIPNLQHTGGSGDLGADLIGFDANGGKVVVQCKRYAPGNHVGSRDIQHFIGMAFLHHQAQRGIFVTTSTFTQPARDLADQHNIMLIDGKILVNLVRRLQGNAP